MPFFLPAVLFLQVRSVPLVTLRLSAYVRLRRSDPPIVPSSRPAFSSRDVLYWFLPSQGICTFSFVTVRKSDINTITYETLRFNRQILQYLRYLIYLKSLPINDSQPLTIF